MLRKRLRIWACLVAGAGAVACGGPGPAPSLAPAVESAAPAGVHHTVEPGQTLWTIARTYDVEMHRIAAANEIVDASTLEAGDRIWIPGAVATLEVPRTFGTDSGLPATTQPAAGSADPETNSTWLWPLVRAAVLSHYGAPRGHNRTHRGLDIRGRYGEPVLAARDGKVIYASDGMRGYGKTVILDHGDGYRSLYAHNSKLLVSFGAQVVAGQPIARVGRTGNASGDHLHFEIRQANRPVDPLPYLNLARKGPR